MAAIGVLSDSEGDLELFDAALKFLAGKGARRFLFAGGRYSDLDDWVKWKREEVRASSDYSDADFLEDVERFLIGLEQVDRPAAFGTAYEAVRAIEELTRLKDKILRTPERGSLAYQDSAVPNKVMDLLGDTLCCLVHDKDDLNKEDMVNAVVLVHGKEPEPKVVQIGPRTFVSPGRLKGGKQPIVGLINVVDRQLTFSAFTLDGKTLIDRQVLSTGGKSKVSVR
ncbi:MAG: hypothetical protein AB1730_11870 [Myxococcota bacterium]|jgi:hypothetical protein